MKMPMHRRILLAAAISLIAVPAAAQSAVVLKNEIRRLAEAAAGEREDLVGEIVDNAVKVKLAADGKKANEEFLAFRRADVQIGATSGSSGTTSAVGSPLLPAIFGVAFENGSIIKTVSGNTVTLKVNPAGLICANTEVPSRVAFRDPDACRTFWKRVGVTAAFDTSRGAKSDKLAQVDSVGRQFAELAVRAELVNRRQPRPYTEFIEKAQAFVNQLAPFNAMTSEWRRKLGDELGALTRGSEWSALTPDKRAELVAAKIDAHLKELPEPPGAARTDWLAALKAQQRADLNRLAITAVYAFQQPDIAAKAIGDPVVVPAGARPPNLHTLRLIVARGAGHADLTFNGSASWFQQAPVGKTRQWRDVQAAAEVKFRMRDIRNYGAPTLSFAGLYMYLKQPPLGLGISAFTGPEVNQPGDLYLFQMKLELPTANNAMRIPLSFTASNRTELIKEKDVRGQIGVSFNLDALFAQGR